MARIDMNCVDSRTFTSHHSHAVCELHLMIDAASSKSVKTRRCACKAEVIFASSRAAWVVFQVARAQGRQSKTLRRQQRCTAPRRCDRHLGKIPCKFGIHISVSWVASTMPDTWRLL
eukprot:1786388-Pleurochrysis_carterae.AAC.4